MRRLGPRWPSAIAAAEFWPASWSTLTPQLASLPAPGHAGTASRETGPRRAIVQAWPAHVRAIPAITTSYQSVVHSPDAVGPTGLIDK